MFLSIDVGNTQTTIGLFGEDGCNLMCWRMPTLRTDTSDSLRSRLWGYLHMDGFEFANVDDAAVASVVPVLTRAWLRCFQRMLARDFRDYSQPGGIRRFAHQLQTSLFQPLERVGRGARLVCAAAQNLCAGSFDLGSRLKNLLFILDRAGTGHDGEMAAANGCPVGEGDDCRIRVELDVA